MNQQNHSNKSTGATAKSNPYSVQAITAKISQTPAQMKQRLETLESMTYDDIRSSNKNMAKLSDIQIGLVILRLKAVVEKDDKLLSATISYNTPTLPQQNINRINNSNKINKPQQKHTNCMALAPTGFGKKSKGTFTTRAEYDQHATATTDTAKKKKKKAPNSTDKAVKAAYDQAQREAIKAGTWETRKVPAQRAAKDSNSKAEVDKPQRNKSAMQIYSKEKYYLVKGELSLSRDRSTTVSKSEVIVELNLRWNSLSPGDKMKYYKLASDEKIRYDKEMKIYNAKKSSGGIRSEPAIDNISSTLQQNDNATQRIQLTSNVADNYTSAPQQNNNRTVVNLGSGGVGNESEMSGPDHAMNWQAALAAGTAAPPLSSNIDSSAAKLNLPEEEFGGYNDNDPFENFSDSGEDFTGLLDSLGESKEMSSEELPAAKSSLKIAAPLADHESLYTESAKSPTDVNDPHGSVPTATSNHEEGSKSSEDVSNLIGSSAEERINNIVTGHEEEMEDYTTRSIQVLKKLNDEKEQILVKSITAIAMVRVSQHNSELEKMKDENTSLPMEPGAERDVLEQKKEELESELAEAEKGMTDNANNKVVLSILQNGIDKKEDELTEVNNKLNPFAGKEATLKRKFEGVYQEDLKRLKIDGEKNKAPVRVASMWNALTMD